MASTNKTANLLLSQFLGGDKLTRADYNADMSAIDTKFGTQQTIIDGKAKIVYGATATSVVVPASYYAHTLVMIGNNTNAGLFIMIRGVKVVIKESPDAYTLTQAANGDITYTGNGTTNMSYTMIMRS